MRNCVHAVKGCREAYKQVANSSNNGLMLLSLHLKKQITRDINRQFSKDIFFQNVGIPAPYTIRSLVICLLLIIAFDGILCLLLQLYISESYLYLYLQDLCVFFVCVFYAYFMCIWAK